MCAPAVAALVAFAFAVVLVLSLAGLPALAIVRALAVAALRRAYDMPRYLRDKLFCGLVDGVIKLFVSPAAICPPLRRTPLLPRAVPPLPSGGRARQK